MINRIDSIEIETVRELNALQDEIEKGIGDHEDTEGLLLDATRKAINRFRKRHYDRMFASARRRR